MLKRLLGILVLAGLGIAWYSVLPPRARPLGAAPAGLTAPVRGAIHVHTNRSDGTGSIDDVAAAAARAGLSFVVLTDHGDGTRAAEPPQYRQGVLCIDAVEISTDGGHVVTLGLSSAPYPLGGEPRDVIEDIDRLGGFSIAAHPGSDKPQLRWVEWTAPFGGLEWLNGDSEWRDESGWTLARVLFTYPLRATEALATLLDRPDAVLRRWDVLTQRRRVVAVAGSDAHARLGLRNLGEPFGNGGSLPLPPYEQLFRTFSISLIGLALTGDAAADARAVLEAIRNGGVYSTIDSIGGPAALSFTGTSGDRRASTGDVLPLAGPATLRVEVQAPDDARIDLLKDGEVRESRAGRTLEHVTKDAGVYRVEVSLPGAPGQPPVPWILSNPIYVGRDSGAAPAPPARPPASAFSEQYANGPASGWTVEKAPSSGAAVDVVPTMGGTQLLFRYALGGAASESPFAALVMPAGTSLAAYDRLIFTARAERPMRLSVQVRTAGGEAGERWHRSVYLDATERTVAVHFDDVTPRGVTARRRPVLADVNAVLFVVDTVNTELGASGRIWIDDVRYAK